MQVLYNLLIRLYRLAIGIASLFNPKAKQWIEGRKNIFQKLSGIDFSGDWFWFHAASLGEYEQAKPVIAELKSKRPNLKFLVTFYSPSGYEVRKNDPLADQVFYLPLDTKRNAKKFVDIVKPKQVVFVRYEFWPNFLDALFAAHIPTLVMAANFRANQFMFKSSGGFILKRIQRLDAILTQTEAAKELLLAHGFNIEKVSVSGNSRVDQVIQIASTSGENALIKTFINGQKTLILGSCYALEESFTYPLLKQHPDLKVIMAPHYIDAENIKRLQEALPVKSIRYSEIEEQDTATFQVLVLDTMGMLSSIYKYGAYALIGGGFKDGIHSILEPAASHLPLFFGPKHQPFPEAKALIDLGGAFEVNTTEEFVSFFNRIYESNERYDTCAKAIASYMESQKGATAKIVEAIERIETP